MVHKLPHPLTATVGALYLQSRSYVIKDDVNVQCGATWENLFAERAFGEDDMVIAVGKQL